MFYDLFFRISFKEKKEATLYRLTYSVALLFICQIILG